MSETDIDPRDRPTLGLFELLDRDGQVRQSIALRAWPTTLGRALDNDVVLSDPHLAPHHLRIESDAGKLRVVALATTNGIGLLEGAARRRLRAGESADIAGDGPPLELLAGRSRVRLRLPGQPLAPELPLDMLASRPRRVAPTAAAVALLLAGLTLNTWLDADPDTFWRALGSMGLAAVVAGLGWCGAWALLSKLFTRQARFDWHLKVFGFASVALLALDVLPGLVAFAVSRPWVSSFAFIVVYAVGAAALYYHLLAVEPARPRLLRAVTTVGALAAIGLTLWLNLQRNGRLGEELYMSHLFPPALRLARPVTPEAFIDALAPLQATLDAKAGEPTSGDERAGADDGE
jgi:hypothetical protein